MSSEAPEVPFAFWVDPVTAVKIDYSLPLFNEIDFEVNEGYRRIPHGGVEVGGLLYGKIGPTSLTIEASRPIDCEHAFGPSFLLSERDLANLNESILAAPNDEELHELEPVGWFIAHTRGSLQMTERELELFRGFFPEPKRVTVLVKPERFKPTRFSFLVRSAAGSVQPDGENTAVILPLPGRAGKSGPVLAPAISVLPQTDNTKPEKTISPTRETGQSNGPALAPLSSQPQAQTPVQSSRYEAPAAVQPISAAAETPSAAADSLPAGTSRASGRSARSRPGILILVLLVAALLGCGAGYWAYLQLPPPIISLRVQKEAKNLLVVWDPAETKSSRYAAIRVNNGNPTLLTAEQKTSGIAQVPLAGDSVKVEIMAQHWARESRGIIRFVPENPLPDKVADDMAPALRPAH